MDLLKMKPEATVFSCFGSTILVSSVVEPAFCLEPEPDILSGDGAGENTQI